MPLVAGIYGKGPIWQRFDRWFSRADPSVRLERKLEVLAFVHATDRFTDFDHEPSTMSPDQVEELKVHINRDWFGGAAWPNWSGDAEAIVREAVIRGIEVSLGVPHRPWNSGTPVSLDDYGLSSGSEPPRNWAIEFWTVGAAPWFAASLTWRHDRGDPQRGLVIVTWLTPSDRALVRTLDQSQAQTQSSDAGSGVDPVDASGRFGSWIIGQQHHETIGPPALPDVRSHGNVVTVSPSLDEGGVDPNADY
jgi:hypothetical protein